MLLVNASAGKSRIHGTGLIANEAISTGTVIWVFKPGFDMSLTKAQLDGLSPVVQEQIRKYIYIDVVTGMYILCNDDALFMNHSDQPNTSTQGDRTIAVRDIDCGGEITGDYREFDAATRTSRMPMSEVLPAPIAHRKFDPSVDESDLKQQEPSAPSDLVSLKSVREYVEQAINEPTLQMRVVMVLTAMPREIVAALLNDPCFRIAIDNHVPGRGGTVWMACPGDLVWKGSRTVVLKKRLADAAANFASYVIAHELAHAHLWNGGWGPISDPEEAADALAASWGFSRPGPL